MKQSAVCMLFLVLSGTEVVNFVTTLYSIHSGLNVYREVQKLTKMPELSLTTQWHIVMAHSAHVYICS